MEVPVYNMQGQEVGAMSVDEQALGGQVNAALIKQAYVRYHANTRQGSARTRGRGSVEGSTRKLYKQKGTGRARAGAARTPVRKGGGHTFAKTKTREQYRLGMPVKMRRKANRNALLAKLVDSEVVVVDSLVFDAPSTKAFRAAMAGLKIERSLLVALGAGAKSDNAALSARNVDTVSTCPVSELNCFNMLNHRRLLIAKDDLQAWLDGPSSRTGKGAKGAAVNGEGA